MIVIQALLEHWKLEGRRLSQNKGRTTAGALEIESTGCYHMVQRLSYQRRTQGLCFCCSSIFLSPETKKLIEKLMFLFQVGMLLEHMLLLLALLQAEAFAAMEPVHQACWFELLL
jgi:hypothetical protein